MKAYVACLGDDGRVSWAESTGATVGGDGATTDTGVVLSGQIIAAGGDVRTTPTKDQVAETQRLLEKGYILRD